MLRVLIVLLAFGCTESSYPSDSGVLLGTADAQSFDALRFDVPRLDAPPSSDAQARPDGSAPRDAGPPDVFPDAGGDVDSMTAERARESMVALCEANEACGGMPRAFCADPLAVADMILGEVAGGSSECQDAYEDLIVNVLDCMTVQSCGEIQNFVDTGEVSSACAPSEEDFQNVEFLCGF